MNRRKVILNAAWLGYYWEFFLTFPCINYTWLQCRADESQQFLVNDL